MPLFYQHNINDTTKLAIWHIRENEDFFLEKVTLKKEVMHPHKRLQHLAGRHLLQILQPGFPLDLIQISESNKPFLANGKLHFSISHCRDYAAAIISENKPVGIDVELATPKIEMVKSRFLNESELNLLSTINHQPSTINLQPSTFNHQPSTLNHQLPTLFWSAKEAIYKWHGESRLSFKNNMSLNELFFENEQGFINAHFLKDEKVNLKIEFKFFGNLCVAWVL